MVIANISWPNEAVIFIVIFICATIAGLQTLTEASSLLQTIARDNRIPLLQPFQVSNRNGEPARALVLTLCK